uniref:Putative secreted protein n=1 Tax=Anopheles marajoara TaxID=58244 RepID=A0A2M4CC75_9DIPT
MTIRWFHAKAVATTNFSILLASMLTPPSRQADSRDLGGAPTVPQRKQVVTKLNIHNSHTSLCEIGGTERQGENARHLVEAAA